MNLPSPRNTVSQTLPKGFTFTTAVWAYFASALAWAFCWVPFGEGFTWRWESVALGWSGGACFIVHLLFGVFLFVGCLSRRRSRLPCLLACIMSAYALAVLLDWVIRAVPRSVA